MKSCNIFILHRDRKNNFLIYLFATEALIKYCKSNLSLYRYFPKFTVYQLQISLDQLGSGVRIKKTPFSLKSPYPVFSLTFEVKGKRLFYFTFKWMSIYSQSGNWPQSHFFPVGFKPLRLQKRLFYPFFLKWQCWKWSRNAAKVHSAYCNFQANKKKNQNIPWAFAF